MAKEARCRHVWLYAKRRYKNGDLLQDLKILIGHHVGMYPKDISDWDVLIVLCETVLETLGREPLERRILEIFWDLVCRDGGKLTNLEIIITRFLSILKETRIHNEKGELLVDIGEPDFSLLPASDEYIRWCMKQSERLDIFEEFIQNLDLDF